MQPPHVQLLLIVPLLCILHRLFTFATSFTGTGPQALLHEGTYGVCVPLLIQSSPKRGLLRRKAEVTLSQSCRQVHRKNYRPFQKCQDVNSNQL